MGRPYVLRLTQIPVLSLRAQRGNLVGTAGTFGQAVRYRGGIAAKA